MLRMSKRTLVVLLLVGASLAGSCLLASGATASVTAPKAVALAKAATDNQPLPGTPQCPSPDPAYQIYKGANPFEPGYLPEALCVKPSLQTKIAVIDYGIDPTPQDAGSFLPGANMADGSSNTTGSYQAHGTHVASIIHLVCPTCLIIPIKVGDTPDHSSDTIVASGIRKAVELGAQAFNFSLGAGCDAHPYPEIDAAIQYAIANHVLAVLGAGNCYPGRSDAAGNWIAADNPNAIRVCGYDDTTQMLNASSNYGQLADICGVMNIYADGVSGLDPVGGTSFAAPQATGDVGKMLGINPGMTEDQAKKCLTSTAMPLKSPTGSTVVPLPGIALTYHKPLVCAGYVPPQATLTVKKIGRGTVNDTTFDLLNCGGTCSETVYSGSKVDLIATPANGYSFAGWQPGSCGNPCSVTVNGVTNLTAKFVKKRKVTITVLIVGKGHASVQISGCGPAKSRCTAVDAGAPKVVITITPKAGSHFVRWTSKTCRGQTRICTLRNPMTDLTAVARVE